MKIKNLLSVGVTMAVFVGVAAYSLAEERADELPNVTEETTYEEIEMTDPEEGPVDEDHHRFDDRLIYSTDQDETEAVTEVCETEQTEETEEAMVSESEVVTEEVIISETEPQESFIEEPIETTVKPDLYDYESASYFENRCVEYLLTDYDIKVSPDPDADVLVTLEKGTAIDIVSMSSESPWLMAEINGSIGYVNIMAVTSDANLAGSDIIPVSDEEAEELWQQMI